MKQRQKLKSCANVIATLLIGGAGASGCVTGAPAVGSQVQAIPPEPPPIVDARVEPRVVWSDDVHFCDPACRAAVPQTQTDTGMGTEAERQPNNQRRQP